MNISKREQRVLHALAQGGAIHYERGDNGKIARVACFTREGHVLTGCGLAIFTRLKKWRLIKSTSGAPYRITKRGTETVRAQMDNR
ncbi:MAG: YjhX family toxin [Pseudomonadota bacterium]